MARRTGRTQVRASQREPRLRVVVARHFPIRFAMTGRAIVAELPAMAFALVVLSVAGDAGCAEPIRVEVIGPSASMAGFAARLGMPSPERVLRVPIVRKSDFPPGALRVTALAFVAIATAVPFRRIILAMARDALGGQLVSIEMIGRRSAVTGDTPCLTVLPLERVPGIAIVLKHQVTPGLFAMTRFAPVAEAAAMPDLLIIGAMTGHTMRGQLLARLARRNDGIRSSRLVTGLTACRPVLSLQTEFGLVVVEVRRPPAALVVT